MSTPSPSSPLAKSGSLLEGLEIPAAPAHAVPHTPRPFIPPILRDNRPVRWLRAHRRASLALLATLLITTTAALYLALRPTPQPDFATASIDDLLDYTLITDDFNSLPLDERLALLRELIKRFRGMSGDESVMMAGWAAAIEGDLREQMEKNASLLAIDLWDRYAATYQGVPEEGRSDWMDATVVEFMKTMESFNPAGARDIPDADRLAEAKRQAQRDVDAVKTGKVSSGQLGQMADFMRNGMGRFAAPQTQTRAAQLMRDMTRHLRGQDILTGKPAR